MGTELVMTLIRRPAVEDDGLVVANPPADGGGDGPLLRHGGGLPLGESQPKGRRLDQRDRPAMRPADGPLLLQDLQVPPGGALGYSHRPGKLAQGHKAFSHNQL
jgi:hypothetical protein